MGPQQFSDPLGDGWIQCRGLGHSSSMRAAAARLTVMARMSRGDPLRPASPRLRSPRSICDVLPTAAALLSVPGAVDVLGVTDTIGDARRVAVVLVDGMGWHLLPALADAAPLLASVLAGDAGRLDELACTFPSTTPTSLVSLTTGATPGEHGILGFTVKLPDSEKVLSPGKLAVQRQQAMDDDEVVRFNEFRANAPARGVVVDRLEDRLAGGQQLQVLFEDVDVVAVGVERCERLVPPFRAVETVIVVGRY